MIHTDLFGELEKIYFVGAKQNPYQILKNPDLELELKIQVVCLREISLIYGFTHKPRGSMNWLNKGSFENLYIMKPSELIKCYFC